MNRKFAIVIAVLVLVVVGIIVLGCNKQPMQTTAAPPPPPGNLAASNAFLQDWNDFQTLQAKIKQVEKETNIRALYDQLNGMATRLQGQVPTGYVWDENTKSFAPIPRPPAPQPTPAPIPKKP